MISLCKLFFTTFFIIILFFFLLTSHVKAKHDFEANIMENIVITWLYLLFDHGQSLSEVHRILSPLHGTVICKNLK